MAAAIRLCCYQRCYRPSVATGPALPAKATTSVFQALPGVVIPLAGLKAALDVDELPLSQVQTAG